MSRREELADNYARVQEEVLAACRAHGRNPSDVHIIGVTKTWPASDIRILADLGVRDIGESRDQEASHKHNELQDLDVTWHFIGQVQTNKVNHIATYADVVHSVDRPKLITALGRAALAAGRTLTALIQVSLEVDDEVENEGRGGVSRAGVLELAGLIDSTPGLVLGGLMAVAPLGEDSHQAFARLVPVSAQLRAAHPQATTVSAGMSDDFSEAIAAGATHLRIGSALLGSRPLLG
ncbi:MAG: hypothetical protein RL410_4 [Actinomycetota bacterium]|jgi:pyridoxal phosphate enzyme (YggS family)